jgi:hypothetical protein
MLYQQNDRRRAKGSPDSPGARALKALLVARGPEAEALHRLVEPSTLRSHAEGHALPGYPFLYYYQAAGVRVEARRVQLGDFVAEDCAAAVALVLPSLEEARKQGEAARKTARKGGARAPV